MCPVLLLLPAPTAGAAATATAERDVPRDGPRDVPRCASPVSASHVSGSQLDAAQGAPMTEPTPPEVWKSWYLAPSTGSPVRLLVTVTPMTRHLPGTLMVGPSQVAAPSEPGRQLGS